MKNAIPRILTISFTSLFISFFVCFYNQFNYRYFFFFLLSLVILEIFLPIQNIVFFIITTFSILVFLYPILKSFLLISFPYYHFSAEIIIIIIISLFFLKISTYSQIKPKAVFISTVISTLIYFVFRINIPYEHFLDFILLSFISAILFLLIWDGNIILKKASLLSSLFFFVGTICLILLPGIIEKDGKLNIGLIESKWCITTGSFKDDYTMKSSYSYSLMKEMIGNKHHLVWLKHYSQLEKKINSLNILFVITPVKPFSAREISLIKDFVARGGTLVAIADHTDLYGHARVLNDLLGPYGVKVNNTSLFNPKTNQAFVNIKGMEFDKLRIKTPSSLSIFRPSYVWAWANHWVSEKGDYSKPNFFGDFRWSSDDLLGNWPIGATIKYHKGQVVAFCDSTIFANFALFQPNYLNLLCNTIDGNRFASHSSFYGGIFAFVILIACFLNKMKFLQLRLFSFILIFLSCSYFQQNNRSESMYLDNKLNIYCDQNIILEPQPNQIPQSLHFSSAYSNIARSGLYPFYKGYEITEKIEQPSLLITIYDDFINKFSEKLGDDTKVIILDEIPEKNIFEFKKRSFPYEVNTSFNRFLNILPVNRDYYTNDNKHNVSWERISVLATYGILNDRFIGNWWINNDISPYRRYALESFYNWLIKDADIKLYKYPSLGLVLTKGSDKWHFKTEGGSESLLYLSVRTDKNSFVYCGSGVWAIYSFFTDKQFLLGGPEFSDDLLATGMVRWAAKRESARKR